MDVVSYLARIGLDAPPAVNRDGLRRLQLAHLLAVPFENLHIARRQPLSLDRGKLYEKIVEKRRGGICYELNGLFAELLEALGFQVERLSARVFSQSEGTHGRPRDHLCLRVVLEGTPWLVDVGFGRGFRSPLRLDTRDWQDDPEGRFRVLPEGEELALERADGGGEPTPVYLLDPREDLALEAFEEMCLHHQTSRDSHFTLGPLCSIARADGRDSLRDGVAVRERGGRRDERQLASEAEVWGWIRDEVGLE
ncbi:MAG: arylamine N-acetyltransferase [Planctomycetota bacterium]|nr:arylamine N-acetyltransferase [Planctomycetota bacterium]